MQGVFRGTREKARHLTLNPPKSDHNMEIGQVRMNHGAQSSSKEQSRYHCVYL